MDESSNKMHTKEEGEETKKISKMKRKAEEMVQATTSGKREEKL